MGTAVFNRCVQRTHGPRTPSLCGPGREPGPGRRNAAGHAERTAHPFARPAPSCNNALPLPRPPPLPVAPQLPRCPPRPAAAQRRADSRPPPSRRPKAAHGGEWGEGGCYGGQQRSDDRWRLSGASESPRSDVSSSAITAWLIIEPESPGNGHRVQSGELPAAGRGEGNWAGKGARGTRLLPLSKQQRQ